LPAGHKYCPTATGLLLVGETYPYQTSSYIRLLLPFITLTNNKNVNNGNTTNNGTNLI
jgi:hypothetical protein